MRKKKQVGNKELSEIAIKNNLRISTPYGYYPEDTDKVLLKYEELVNTLQSETIRLEKELSKVSEEKKIIENEFRKMKFEISLMEVPDTSTEEDFSMMSRLTNINSSVGNMPESKPDIIESTHEIDIAKESYTKDDSIVFDNLISKSNYDSVKKPNIYDENGNLEIL